MRSDILGCHGGRAVTPHLDALAGRASDFRRHFANSPVCVPSRATLYTGRYPRAHAVLENDVRLAPEEAHLFKILQASGYRIGYFGKNHLLPDDEFAANLDAYDAVHGTDKAPEFSDYRTLSRDAMHRMETMGCHAGAAFHDCPDAATPTGRITHAVEAFLDGAPADRPWCAVASYYDPHAPHLAPRRFASLHPPKDLTLPPFMPGELARVSPRSAIKWQAQGADHATDDEKRHYLSVYLSMCSYVDEQVGRLVRLIDSRGETADTVILFVSDHGDFCWQHGMCKKDLVLWDALLHIPLLISWPGEVRSQSVNTMTSQVDLLPSLLDLLGLERPAGLQGRSLAPLLRGEPLPDEDAVFAEVCHPWMRNPYSSYADFDAAWKAARHHDDDPLRYTASYNIPGDHVVGVRTRHWKYIRFAHGFEELYDLEADPAERRNLALEPALSDNALLSMRSVLLDAIIRARDPLTPLQRAALHQAFPRWKSVREGCLSA